MPWVVAAFAIAYAGVSTFGAWTLVHRARALAWTHLAAAALLMVGAVAVAYELRSGVAWLGAGAALASGVSWWTARSLATRVVARNHVARAAYGAAVAFGAWLVTA
ncbi:MAG: hypothetical protein RI554_02920 [Trueperaceae bacterium]|nr:hypothetical protein [Trueperaceae bacterium]